MMDICRQANKQSKKSKHVYAQTFLPPHSTRAHVHTGSVFWQINPDDVYLRVSVLYTTIYVAFFVSSLVPFPDFMEDRPCFYSQRDRSFYSTKVRVCACACVCVRARTCVRARARVCVCRKRVSKFRSSPMVSAWCERVLLTNGSKVL